jgi:hypothetical protein
MFHNSSRGILRVEAETFIGSGERCKPRVSKVPTNDADLAD